MTSYAAGVADNYIWRNAGQELPLSAENFCLPFIQQELPTRGKRCRTGIVMHPHLIRTCTLYVHPPRERLYMTRTVWFVPIPIDLCLHPPHHDIYIMRRNSRTRTLSSFIVLHYSVNLSESVAFVLLVKILRRDLLSAIP